MRLIGAAAGSGRQSKSNHTVEAVKSEMELNPLAERGRSVCSALVMGRFHPVVTDQFAQHLLFSPTLEAGERVGDGASRSVCATTFGFYAHVLMELL